MHNARARLKAKTMIELGRATLTEVPITPPEDEPILMTSKNRNTPCPCGSGRKVKKCHGVTKPTSGFYDRPRPMSEHAKNKIMQNALGWM